MQGSGLELKMIKGFSDRQQVFQATETALRVAENRLMTTPFTSSDLSSATCASGSASCFEDTCTGGLCFLGDNTSTTANCVIYTGTPPAMPIWHDGGGFAVWDNASFHLEQNPTDSSGITVKYIIEFQCFVDAGSDTVISGGGHAFYRITALGANASGLTEVMLQSTLSTPALQNENENSDFVAVD